MKCSKLSFGVMGLLLLASTVMSAGCARKSVILRESDNVWFLNQGDPAPADDLICMYKGTFMATFENTAMEILEAQ